MNGRLQVEAPSEPGVYKVIGYVVFDPTLSIEKTNLQVEETSLRFTLQVEGDARPDRAALPEALPFRPLVVLPCARPLHCAKRRISKSFLFRVKKRPSRSLFLVEH